MAGLLIVLRLFIAIALAASVIVPAGYAQDEDQATIVLLLQNDGDGRAIQDLRAMHTPGSARFGRPFTPKEYSDRYGASDVDVDRVQRQLTIVGLDYSWQRGNGWMLVNGATAALERFFDAPAPSTYDEREPLSIPRGLRPLVRGASWLGLPRSQRAGPVPGRGMTPEQVRKAYDIAPLHERGYEGRGQTVAFIAVDAADQRDLDAYTDAYNLPKINARVNGPDRRSGHELTMDLEVVHAIAPRARLRVYPIGSDAHLLDVTDLMVTQNPRSIISVSVGACERDPVVAQAEDEIYRKAALLGSATFAASGDNGAFDCLGWGKTYPDKGALSTDLPAAGPHVTAVGGTRLRYDDDGTYLSESVWSSAPATQGSGGGVSRFFARPWYQKSLGRSATNRMLPDVAASADSSHGMSIHSKVWLQGGGTSQAAPILAGIAAVVHEYLDDRDVRNPGFWNPTLYALASDGTSALRDVSSGNNLHYPAKPGYDLATGLGTPRAWRLARAFETYLKDAAP